MDINTYADRFTSNGGNLSEFAKKAGMSRMYLGHILKGRKKNPSFETVLGIISASDGQISIRSLRPDLFPQTPGGDQALDLVIKSASAA